MTLFACNIQDVPSPEASPRDSRRHSFSAARSTTIPTCWLLHARRLLRCLDLRHHRTQTLIINWSASKHCAAQIGANEVVDPCADAVVPLTKQLNTSMRILRVRNGESDGAGSTRILLISLYGSIFGLALLARFFWLDSLPGVPTASKSLVHCRSPISRPERQTKLRRHLLNVLSTL